MNNNKSLLLSESLSRCLGLFDFKIKIKSREALALASMLFRVKQHTNSAASRLALDMLPVVTSPHPSHLAQCHAHAQVEEGRREELDYEHHAHDGQPTVGPYAGLTVPHSDAPHEGLLLA